MNPTALAERLAHEHVADIVDVLNAEPVESAASILLHLPFQRAAEVLDQPGLDTSDLLAALPVERATALMAAMSADRAADAFRRLEEPHRSAIFERLDAETKGTLQRLLAYPPDTAGSIM